jgi:acetylornithine aminotransferase
MGAVLIAPDFTAVKSMLGTTFGGNHLACAAAIAVLDVIESENLIRNSYEVGEYLLAELRKMPELKDVRGRGLMIGVEVEGSGSEMRRKLLFEKHIFTGGAGVSTVRLLPALYIGKAEADRFLRDFKSLLTE